MNMVHAQTEIIFSIEMTAGQDPVGLAKAVAKITENSLEGKGMKDGLDGYNIDKDVFKVRIAYSKYLG